MATYKTKPNRQKQILNKIFRLTVGRAWFSCLFFFLTDDILFVIKWSFSCFKLFMNLLSSLRWMNYRCKSLLFLNWRIFQGEEIAELTQKRTATALFFIFAWCGRVWRIQHGQFCALVAAAPHMQSSPHRDQTQEWEIEQSVLNACDFEPLGKNDWGLSISSSLLHYLWLVLQRFVSVEMFWFSVMSFFHLKRKNWDGGRHGNS